MKPRIYEYAEQEIWALVDMDDPTPEALTNMLWVADPEPLYVECHKLWGEVDFDVFDALGAVCNYHQASFGTLQHIKFDDAHFMTKELVRVVADMLLRKSATFKKLYSVNQEQSLSTKKVECIIKEVKDWVDMNSFYWQNLTRHQEV